MTDLGNQRVDGLSQWTADHPVIVVNSANPTDRIRWTLAHEIGHLVLHREDSTDDMEKEADAFAAEFLMPEILIRSELANLTLGKAVDLNVSGACPLRPSSSAPVNSACSPTRGARACSSSCPPAAGESANQPATRSHLRRPNC